MRITKDQEGLGFSVIAHLDTYTIEASTLGLKPGEFPKTIDTDIGNGCPFSFQHFDEHGNARYEQNFGCVSLLIWND